MAATPSVGIVVGTKKHDDSHLIVTVFTADRGKIRGLVKGGQKKAPDFVEGNIVHLRHARRLEGQLGTLTAEVVANPASRVFHSLPRLQAVRYVADVLRTALTEETPQPKLFDRTLAFLEHLPDPDFWARMGRYELDLLAAFGFALSLTHDSTYEEAGQEPLCYVSPKTGMAVTEAMGYPYRDRLLLLPPLFGGIRGGMVDVFKLTGHFLAKALDGRDIPSRQTLLDVGEQTDFTEDRTP